MAQLGLYACAACPEDCGVAVAPNFDINECVDAIEFYDSEIAVLYMTGVDPDDCTVAAVWPADPTAALDWAALINNTGAGAIRAINVVGDMPAKTSTPLTFSKGRIKNVGGIFTANITIDEFNLTNYAAMRLLECGYTGFFAFQTLGGMLYGAATGIKAQVISADAPKVRGENNFEKIEIVLQWKSKCSPDMIVSPITQAAC